jgi:hypothetical protein
MEDTDGFITTKLAGGLAMPDKEAMILVSPATMPVARPDKEIVATEVSELLQAASSLMSAVEPSEYVPIASNCWVKPAFKLGAGDGVTAIEDNVGKDLDVGDVDVVIMDVKIVDVEVGGGVNADVVGAATNGLLAIVVVNWIGTEEHPAIDTLASVDTKSNSETKNLIFNLAQPVFIGWVTQIFYYRIKVFFYTVNH